MGSSGSPIIHYDYGRRQYITSVNNMDFNLNTNRAPEFSPYGQKVKLLLTAAGVPFERVDVPPVLPRKDLEALGITYRRIPVLAVGKDVYCDTSLMFDLVTNKLAKNKLPTSPAVSTK